MNQIKQLEKIFGTDDVLSDTESIISYSCDASAIKQMPLAIVFPKYEDQLHKLMIYANRSKLKLTPRGAATGLCGGSTPSKDSVVIDFSKMNKIIQIDTKSKTATVEPGVILDDLNEILLEHGLFFPVIPGSHESCQIGGMIATNAAGMRAIRYGKMQNWVMQLNVIDGSGKYLDLKNPSDFIGSEGTIGIITKAKIILTEPITESSMTIEHFSDRKDMVERVKEIREKENILSIEFLDKLTSELSGIGKNYTLIIEYDDIDNGEIKDSDMIKKIDSKRDSIAPLLMSKGYDIIEDPKIPIDHMEKFITWLEKNDIPSFGHIGIGILHPRFKDDQKELISEMFKFVEKHEGNVTGEHGIGILKKEHAPREFKAEIRGLKHKYDPNNVLNPGKII